MSEIKLIVPSMEYAEDIMEFRKELKEAKDVDTFAGCTTLQNCESAEEWFQMLDRCKSADTCPKERVPFSAYMAVRCSDNKIVGMIDVRHHIDHPTYGLWGGHMGYSIRPDERRKGYGKEMVKLNLENCRNHGLNKVMITCSDENPASERVILANGGVYEKTVFVDGENIKRYWITL